MINNNLRYAFRNLKRNKMYSFINIAGLAVSLAACWLIVLFISDELSFDRSNLKADRIVRLVQHSRWEGAEMNLAVTPDGYLGALKTRFPEVEDAVRIDAEGGRMIEQNGKKLNVGDMIQADASLFNIFSYTFLAGNAAAAMPDPQSIVITADLARILFGSPDAAFQQRIHFADGDNARVTAVIADLPENLHFRFRAVRPIPAGAPGNWQNSHVHTYALLKKTGLAPALEKKLAVFTAATVNPALHLSNYHVELQPLLSIHLQSALDYELSPNGSLTRIYIFAGIALLILLIAVINYINLATARASERVKEIGVRKTIGSGKMQLARLFITEALLVTVLAGILGLVLIQFFMPAFRQITGKDLSVWQFGYLPTIGFTLAFSVFIGVLSGLYPSVLLSRLSTIPALKGNLGNLGGTIFFRKALLVVQFVITVFMISAAFVIYSQLQFARHTDLGFNRTQTLVFHISNRSVRAQIPALKAKLFRNPVVEGVAAAGNPIGNNDLGGRGYFYEMNDHSQSGRTKVVQQLMVDADYLPAMQIKLAAGRNFSPSFSTDSNSAALVNETLVRELGWTNPVGMKLLAAGDNEDKIRTVVGVVHDFHTYSLQHKVQPMVLVLPPDSKEQDNLYIRLAKGKTREGLAWVDQVYKTFDPGDPVELHLLDQNFALRYAAEEKQGNLALLFSGLAILLSVLGLFGLVSFTARQLTKQIGIRKVLGASVGSIIGLVSKDFLRLVLLASAIAIPVSWYFMHRWLMGFEYRITPGIGLFLGAGAVAAFVAVITLGLRAFRAAQLNPVKSLRSE